MSVEILHRDDLHRGGFAGLKEHRMVMDPKAFGPHINPGTWAGIGSFVYLADARFDPHGETRMHSHREIDVISVMVEGNISHEGSLEHGQGLNAYDVQVQRAGGEGFSHNEINPDNAKNRMIQIWALPEKSGQPAGYKMYSPKWGEIARIYGGSQDQEETFDSRTLIDVGLLNPEQKVVFELEFMAYLTLGSGTANGEKIEDGDLTRGTRLEFTANEKSQLIVVHF
jgi:redox-sensitive bicupin YhaK (pirin superfamily)